jgi:MFS family permease
MKEMNLRFWILVSIVAISGFSQGMLLPLIAVIFENNGVSPSLNGLNATALYIGILLVSPFMEMPLRKYGYKPVIIYGGGLVIISLALFPLWQTFWFWFTLRLLIGMAIIHFILPHRPGLHHPPQQISGDEIFLYMDYFLELALPVDH